MNQLTAEQTSLVEALRRVEMGSSAWQPFARLAVQETASRFASFTSDHVWQTLIRHRIPFPREGRAMAPAMKHGITMGWMEATERFETVASPATGRHPGPQRVYVSRIAGKPNPEWPEVPRDSIAARALTPKGDADPGGPGEPVDAATLDAVLGPPQNVKCPKPDCDRTVFLMNQTTFDPRYWDARCMKHGKVMVRV